jgi:hypothetical protein
MSATKQAMAARRKGKHDKRYSKLARKDANVRAAKLNEKWQAEQARKQRSKKK